jgi:hypothetical protein
VAVALIVRVYRLTTFSAVIENEGVHFVRLAANLLAGRGYLGMPDTPELSFAPLYPVLIAGVMPFTSPDVAGRLVAVVFGCLLTVPMFLLAREVFGRTTAIICGILTALHPVLVAYSTAVYNESVYLPLMTAGLLATLLCIRRTKLLWALLGGVFFGLAYLTRPEAMALPLLAVFCFFLFAVLQRHALKNAVLASAVLAVSFLVIASPYVAFLSSNVGELAFQTKGKLNYTIGARFNEGMPYDRAAMGIADDGTIEGPFLDPVKFSTYTPYAYNAGALLGYFKGTARRNVGQIELAFGGPAFGLILVSLAVLGLVGAAWDKRVSVANIFFFGVFCFFSFVVLQAHIVQPRYLLPFYVLFLIWASHGIALLWNWTTESLRLSLGWETPRLALLVPIGVTAALLVSSIRGVSWSSELAQGGEESVSIKRAGEWIKEHYPPHMVVMTTGDARPAHYAGAVLEFLPYAESNVALEFIRSKHPAVLVLSGADRTKRPYLADWMDNGIPGSAAPPVYDSGGPAVTRMLIYEWR